MERKELIQLLKKYCNLNGISGFEDEVRENLKNDLKEHVDVIRVDKFGNVIGIKYGKDREKKLMLAAHMDEVGLIVKLIDKNGFVMFSKIGGIDDRVLLSQPVLILTEKGPIRGIIGSKPPHIQKEAERTKAIPADKLFIDVGADSKEDCEKMGIKIGDPIVFDFKASTLGEHKFCGKAIDDRVGCVELVAVAEQLAGEETEHTIYFVGTVQEEVGLRGARVAAYAIYPNVAIAVDVTIAGGVPGLTEYEAPVKMGKGPTIVVEDRGLITHPRVLNWIVKIAEENKIKYQLETGLTGTTDAAAMSLVRAGVPAGVISVPTRYIHSAPCMVDLRDVEETIKLISKCCLERLPL